MNWETLLCIGDSITIGARSYLGYPEYISNYLEAKCPSKWNVINQAISGYTVIDIGRTVTSEFSNLQCQNPSVATILIGTNDVKKQTDIDLFKIAYERLIIKTLLLIPGKNLSLIEIPLLGKGVKYPYTIAMNDEIPKFNEVINQLAKHMR